ncbi:hypothetical protein BV22DRAFT_1036909 [Leucogyrophana mollusca]|uniref:Uncharacterized protein n=1 Tax=Leucogyrophana mollusca TaxID=85980 RepID=A0ACB8BDT3_9AGAM|nr:hypothetical protein BV22DRAFT_1036909 [Leucogyrophana mollusca]
MGVLASRVNVNVDGQQIADMIIRGLGGREAVDAIRMMSQQVAWNSGQVVASVDRTLASITTDIHGATSCFMVLMMTLTAYLVVLMVLRGLRERRERRLLLLHEIRMQQYISWGPPRLVLLHVQTDENSALVTIDMGARMQRSREQRQVYERCKRIGDRFA